MIITPETIITFLGFSEAVTLALIGGAIKLLEKRQAKRDRSIVERNTEIGKARDKAQDAFELQIEAALDLTNDLTVAVQTGQTNGFISDSKTKFDSAVERAQRKKQEAHTELNKAYSKTI